MAAAGWMKLYRKMLNHPLWLERRVFSRAEAWIDLMMCAQYTRTTTIVTISGRRVECGYGQIIRSFGAWGERWMWGMARVRKFMRDLVFDTMIVVETVWKTTRITICNYSTYQDSQRADRRADRRAESAQTEGQTEGHSFRNKEGVKEGKKGRRVPIGTPATASPTRGANVLWDAVAGHWFGGAVAKPQKTRVGKIVRDLGELGATPDELARRIARHKTTWPSAECSPESMVKNWARFAPGGGKVKSATAVTVPEPKPREERDPAAIENFRQAIKQRGLVRSTASGASN